MPGDGEKSPEARTGSAGIAQAAARAGRRGPPPVHLWNPPYCGEMDLEIRADGTWFHDGSPIGRPEMVRLFASVLKREGDRFFLVTPVEKLGIRVEDAPFLAVDADITPEAITFTTNVGDVVTAGPDHPIRVEDRDGAPRPYIHVRRGLDALIDRKTFYRLVEAATEETDADRAAFQGQASARASGAVALHGAASAMAASPRAALPGGASPRLVLRSNGAVFLLEP